MEIELNGEKGTCKVAADTPLGEVLSELRSRLSHFGQVVSELVLDGTSLSHANEAEFAGRRVGEFTLLAAASVPVEQIVRAVLRGLLDAIDGIKAKSAAIGTLVQKGRRAEAFGHLGAFTGDLAFFSDGIHHCCSCLGAGKPDVERLVKEGLEELQGLLGRLQSCIHGKEDVELADLLAFEIPESIEKWRAFLTSASAMMDEPAHDHDPRRN
jgi:hypothetical protein